MSIPVQKSVLINTVEVHTILVPLAQANLVIAVAPKDLVMCGYLDISVAQKIGDAACVVTGVESVEELLEKPVVKLTQQAKALGISLGVSGRQALEKML